MQFQYIGPPGYCITKVPVNYCVLLLVFVLYLQMSVVCHDEILRKLTITAASKQNLVLLNAVSG